MPRYAFLIEYDGAAFSGWQRQPDRPSVQGAIEAALEKLKPRADGTPHKITGAGRTDAGVHATGQVAHFVLDDDWDTFRVSEAVNYHLKPARIGILTCARVADDWHARFGAVQRKYVFRLMSRRAPLTSETGQFWHVKQALDGAAMQEAANHLVGHHDFTTFRSTLCQVKSPVKTLEELRVEEIRHPYATEFRFHVTARSFLHNQVRSFVGTLERVGAGSWTPEDVLQALAAKDRRACGPVSPPEGLYLSEVIYPESPFTPASNVEDHP